MRTCLSTRFTRLICLAGLFLLALTGCISTGAAPTASIKTVIPPTPAPGTAVPEVTAVTAGTALTYTLKPAITSPDGVLTVTYPEGWVAEPRGTSISFSTKPGLALLIGQRTFAADEVTLLVDYASRTDVAVVLQLDPDFTLEELGAATEKGVANMTTESIQVSGKPAIAQTGLIKFDEISTDVYSITFEVEGVLVTATTYAAPQQLARIQTLTQAVADKILIDTSLVQSLRDAGGADGVTPDALTTPEG